MILPYFSSISSHKIEELLQITIKTDLNLNCYSLYFF